MASAVKKRVLWLHTQPEHYHNRMLEDLAAGTGYRVPGMTYENSQEFQWVAGFAHQGPGLYKENVPKGVETHFLRALPGKEGRPPRMGERYHIDWLADLQNLNFSAVIVAGYAQRTFRELIAECRRRRIPVAMWSDSNLRSDHGHTLKMRLKRALKRRLLRRVADSVDALPTANRLGVAYWRYYGGKVSRRKIQLSPCYTDYAAIDAARTRDRGEVLAKIGLSPDAKIIYSAARLIPVKGLDLMIRAFRAGGYESTGWKYVIAGSGVMEAQLKSLAGDALGKSILFAGFQQPANNLALMAQAALMALPSRYEPHGIVVGESLAAGVPVLASHVVGAVPGLVKTGESGLIFRSEDIDDLTKKLTLLNDPAKLAAMRPTARDAFESWYRQTSPILQIPRIVRQLLAGKPS